MITKGQIKSHDNVLRKRVVLCRIIKSHDKIKRS
jgi:hypothetical protein